MPSLATILFVQSIMVFLFRVLLMSTILLGAGLLACRLMKRSAAADRHVVLTTSLVAVLFAPFLTAALPAISVFRGLNDGDAVALLVPSRAEPASGNSTAGAAGKIRIADVISIPWFLREPALYLLAITLLWPFGLVLFGGRLLNGAFAAAHLRRLRFLPHGIARRRAEAVIKELGIRREILLVTSIIPIPVTTGILKPVVILPDDVDQWSSGTLRCVLQHELAHVRRLDVMWQGIAHVVRAILWFHPLAWLAARRLCAESEAACDAAVIQTGVRPSEYAQELLHIAEKAACATLRPYAFAIGMSYGPRLDTRLRQLLHNESTHAPRSRWLLYCAAAFALVLLIPFGSGRYAAQEEPAASQNWRRLIKDTVSTGVPFEEAADSRR